MKRPRLVLASAVGIVALIGFFFLVQPPKPTEPAGFQGGPATFYPRTDLGAGTTLRQDYDRLDGENQQ